MPSDRPPLTQERLKELLHYEPETGHFTRRVSSGGASVGSRAGSPTALGYLLIGVGGGREYAHRLAFLYVTGEFPAADVDHINRSPGDNRWSNLRLASRSENNLNSRVSARNTSGHRGVQWFARDRKWRAYGKLNGFAKHLGYFDDLAEAAATAQKWREENFGVFALEAGQPNPAPVASKV